MRQSGENEGSFEAINIWRKFLIRTYAFCRSLKVNKRCHDLHLAVVIQILNQRNTLALRAQQINVLPPIRFSARRLLHRCKAIGAWYESSFALHLRQHLSKRIRSKTKNKVSSECRLVLSSNRANVRTCFQGTSALPYHGIESHTYQMHTDTHVEKVA
jgi:hypothetical protein